jgi:hypothetical protein
MPFDPSAIPQRLVEAARQRNLVPLVGAGISKQAGDAFPNWHELLARMKEYAVADGFLPGSEGSEIDRLLDRGQFLMAAEAIRRAFPSDEYERFLEEQFNPAWAQPVDIHRALFRLQPPLILTTNYDRLIEDACSQQHGRAPTVVTYRDTHIAQRYLQSGRPPQHPILFKIHGSVDEPQSIVLSDRDYRDLIYRQTGYRIVLSAIFLTHIVVMLGFSLADREIILLLETLRESLKHPSDPDFIFLPRDSAGPLEIRRWREDFGVQVIAYDPSPGHPEVLEFVDFLVGQMQSAEPGSSA